MGGSDALHKQELSTWFGRKRKFGQQRLLVVTTRNISSLRPSWKPVCQQKMNKINGCSSEVVAGVDLALFRNKNINYAFASQQERSQVQLQD